MRDRILLILWLGLPVVAGALAVVALQPGWAFPALAGAYIAAHLVTIPNTSGHQVSLSPAVAGGAALVTGGSLVFVLGAAAVVLPIGWAIVHLRHGRRAAAEMFPSEPVGLVVFASAFAGALSTLPSRAEEHPAVLAAFTGAALLGFGAAVVARVLLSQERHAVARRLILVRALADWPAYAALYSSAALYAVTWRPLGAWSVPLAGLPYLFSHLSLDRLQDTRRTYEQTIRALGAIPEASGQVSTGHSARTADLGVAVGAEIGLGGRILRRLEYAALLHDIGRVVLANPAVAQGDYSFADVSEWSAAIISEARYLEPVADIVALQHAPFRRQGQVRDEQVGPGSQIVRIVARYDSAIDEGNTPVEAVELLHRGAAYDYDPEIVMALRRVLERRGVLAA